MPQVLIQSSQVKIFILNFNKFFGKSWAVLTLSLHSQSQHCSSSSYSSQFLTTFLTIISGTPGQILLIFTSSILIHSKKSIYQNRFRFSRVTGVITKAHIQTDIGKFTYFSKLIIIVHHHIGPFRLF